MTETTKQKTVADAYGYYLKCNLKFPDASYEYIIYNPSSGDFYTSRAGYMSLNHLAVCTRKEFEAYAKEQEQNEKPVYTHELMVRNDTNTPEQYEPAIKVFSGQKFSVFINQNGKEYVRKNSKVKFRLIDTRTYEEKLIDEMENIISKHCQDGGALKDLPKTLLEFYDITPK